MRIDCNATTPNARYGSAEHRCCLEPGHDTAFHLCDYCTHSWPNHAARITTDGVA